MIAFTKTILSKKQNYGFLVGSILVFVYLVSLATSNGDFKVFLEAANLLKSGQNIYNTWICTAKDVYCLYFYSPLFALILIPFSYLPNFIPNLIWLTACAFWSFRIWELIEQRFKLESFTKKEKSLLVFLSFLMVFRFLLYNFGLIQMTIFLLWAILESINLFEKKKNLKGSLLLALAINIKLMPIVTLPYLIYRKKFVPAMLVIILSIGFLFLPAIFIGVDFNHYLLKEWWSVINPLQKEQTIETGLGVHSLTALIPSLLITTEGEIDLKRNIIELSPHIVNIITNCIRLFLITWTFYFLGFKSKKPNNNHQLIWELSYITAVIPLIFPHQQKYAFFLLLPASAYIIYFLMSIYKSNYLDFGKLRWKIVFCLICLSFTLMTLSTDGLIGRYYNQITQHYKTITYGALFLLIGLSVCHPNYLSINNCQILKSK